MPRIPQSILLRAYNKASLLPLVLRGSRSLPSAINELRWLLEHVEETFGEKSPMIQHQQLLHLCRRRSKGEPLQYILGTQPFGELEIKCRSRVLIPRPETEAYTTYLADLVMSNRLTRVFTKEFAFGDDPLKIPKKQKHQGHLRILDLCTGSGCISLLLNRLLSKYSGQVQIHGWDISKDAVGLAKENWKHNIKLGHLQESPDRRVQFAAVDIFDHVYKLQAILRNQSQQSSINQGVNIIVSNPPYISQKAFRTETTRSVRNWEPKLALVPEKQHCMTSFGPRPSRLPKAVEALEAADVFYHRLLTLHFDIFRSQVLVMEAGDDSQAVRVAKTALSYCYARNIRKRNHVEIWRDSPDTGELGELKIGVGDDKIAVRGSGCYRAVVLFK